MSWKHITSVDAGEPITRELGFAISKKRQFIQPLIICVIILASWILLPKVASQIERLTSAENGIQNNETSVLGDIVDDFRGIIPSTTLRWVPCFRDPFQCARLQVPMDRTRPEREAVDHSTVELALIMLPGRHHLETGNYSVSPLILNPGGPGGSGVRFVLSLRYQLPHMIGEDYDIISFDPRGVGWTTPAADCFSFPSDNTAEPSDFDMLQGQFNRLEFTIANEVVGLPLSSNVALGKLDRSARALAQLCKRKADLKGNDSVLHHLDTASVAHDLLSIIDAWDDWRDSSLAPTQIQAELDVENSIKRKLVYLGFSYGTFLGATFAAMYPNRVGRVVLDGVLDADEYVQPFGPESVDSTDDAFAAFFNLCLKAGPKVCAIARPGDNEKDIKIRVEAALKSLENDPVVGVNAVLNIPSIITISRLKANIFMGLYHPMSYFPLLARLLDALHRRDYDQLHISLPPSTSNLTRYLPYCSPDATIAPENDEVTWAVECSDQREALSATLDSLNEYLDAISNKSTFGDAFMPYILGCNGWAIKAKNPTSIWGDEAAYDKPSPIDTSFPLLFISNSRDPVTPLKSGVHMSSRFAHAGLVEQLGQGHCSLAELSICTITKVRDYFRHGRVPAHPKFGPDLDRWREGEWELCETDEWPWHPFGDLTTLTVQSLDTALSTASQAALKQSGMSSQEAVDMVQAWKALQEYHTKNQRIFRRKQTMDLTGAGERTAQYFAQGKPPSLA